MFLTKGQIMMIQNMVNTELSNKNTVYNPTELANLKEQLKLYNVVKRGGTISLSWGKYGGFYLKKGYTTRICLGWVAITYFPEDLDNILARALK